MKHLIQLLFVIIPFTLVAQEISLTKVNIKESDVILKRVKVYDCDYKVEKGKTLKTVTVKNGKDKTYTIESQEVLSKDTSIPVEKEIIIEMTGFKGLASVFTKEDEPDKLYVDYWLNTEIYLEKGTKYREITRTLTCPVDIENIQYSDYKPSTSKTKTIPSKQRFYLEKIEAQNYNKWIKPGAKDVPSWFIHSDRIIEVLDSTENVIEVYVDKYDRDTIYELKLKNRQVIDGIARNWDIGPLTLPFKYRFGFEENGINVDQQFEADINIGAFFGYKIASWGYRKEQGKHLKLPESSINIGSFLSLSALELNASNTSVGENPIVGDGTSSIGTFSTGLGLIFNIKGFNAGAFLGLESAFGARAKDWNYQNRPWLGLGIGYNLNGFKKSE